MTVDPNPVAVTAVWFPGLNAEHCATQLSRAGRALAVRLANDIRVAPGMSGRYNCGPADGARAVLYFSYQDQRQAEIVEVSLTGCLIMGAPGRLPRQLGRLQPDLRPLAPAAFRQFTA